MGTFGILVGGGPAPGLNGVIGAATIRLVQRGHRVIGLYDGFNWLIQGDTKHVIDLGAEDVSRIHLQGGSIIHTSRANPTKKEGDLEKTVETLLALGIDHLITIGGDDTASSAHRIAQTAGDRIKVVHVPKTIDNDLPLPEGIPTFGFETAREHGTTVVERILEDMRTTNRWFFIVMMGRSAGHLSLGAGKAAGAPITLIPEEFPDRPIAFEDVVRTLEGAIVKRLSQGRPDGVAVIAEGIAEYMNPDDPMLQGVPRDEHGHIRLAEIPIAKVLKEAVQDRLAARGVKVTIGEKDVGYELRCGYPIAFDRDYTRDLGVGAVEMLLSGTSSCLIVRQAGKIAPIPFGDIIDPQTGKSRVRGVDVTADSYKAAFALQDRVKVEDLAAEKTLAAIAKAGGLSPDEARARYAPL